MIGAGKYDASCAAVLLATRAETVILMVINGNNGNGMSVKTIDPTLQGRLPMMLRDLANLIELENESKGN